MVILIIERLFSKYLFNFIIIQASSPVTSLTVRLTLISDFLKHYSSPRIMHDFFELHVLPILFKILRIRNV
jgi:hypothetical protein